jgi:uncharacterized protein YggE
MSCVRRQSLRLFATAILVTILGLHAIGAGAQGVTGQLPGIVVTGIGTSTAPATAAAVQVLVGPSMMGMSPSAALTDTDIAPIVAAIVAAGVTKADITVHNPSTNSVFTGPFGPGSVSLVFDLPAPTNAILDDLVQSLYAAATEANLGIQHIGVRYQADDCTSLQQEATDAAVADARSRAGRLATSLDASLGTLTQAMDSTVIYGSPNPTSCPGAQAAGFGPYGPGIESPYDPQIPAEASITVQVTLTFEMIEK